MLILGRASDGRTKLFVEVDGEAHVEIGPSWSADGNASIRLNRAEASALAAYLAEALRLE